VAFQYLLYDVFTDAALAGNQLAVFTDARDVPAAAMQRIARELNLSETTFVLPAERDDTNARMRIFTPAVELPMAGHPTIGSTFALARCGVIARGQRAFTFKWDGDDVRFVWMSQLRPSFGRVVDRSAVATALGLTENDFRPDLPIEEVSCGVPYLIVPLKDADAVARAVPDGAALRRLGEMTGAPLPLYLFAAGQPGPGGSGVFLGPGAQSVKAAARAEHVARMFAPGIGVLEDPATGSAAGPLGCYLVQHAQVSNEGARRIVIQQGASMNRPSVLHVSVDGDADAITSVKVGGGAVLIGRGELYL
jgi:trans-2,3-dihydro-3-hydroxyanthranilate isomerase